MSFNFKAAVTICSDFGAQENSVCYCFHCFPIFALNWCFWTAVLEKTLEHPVDCKEIQPVHLKGYQSRIFNGRTDSNTLATWCKELAHWKRPWCWERLKAGGEGDNRGWDGWMASLTQWTWLWLNSRSWFLNLEPVCYSMSGSNCCFLTCIQISQEAVRWSGTPISFRILQFAVIHTVECECEVKWALGSITTNKASGGDRIPVEPFHILKDDAVKVLHSICQKIWKTQQWPQDWKGQFSFQSQRKAMPKNAQNTSQLHSSHMLAK